MILTILIIIYILSFLRMYFWTRNAYGKDGRYKNIKPERNDFLFTIVPIYNTIASIYVTFISLTGFEEKAENNFNYSKFFNVKK